MIFCGHYRSVFNHCEVIGLQSYRIMFILMQIISRLLCRARSFKVTNVGM